jgi:predicted glycoside hydrolase/deacetylase ChbG (UPF0249 family)
MADTRILIVNADDFGQSPGVNRGIVAAHRRGIVTSASLMVRWPSVEEAVALGRDHPDLGLGLHLDLGEWAYRAGDWVPLYQVIPTRDPVAVADEVARQLDAFHRLVGRPPTHIDSHQHVHRDEPVRSAAVAAARALGVPLRHFSAGVRYCGAFYGQTAEGESLPDTIGVTALLRILAGLGPGLTELACHPALGDDVEGMYRAERALEVEALCDPRVRAALDQAGIELRSFGEVGVLAVRSPLPPGEG